jgi:uncharacterized protein (DUF2062 family)
MTTFVRPMGMFARIAAWSHRNLPKREELEQVRFVAPLARRAELWRFTRRSVPRGVFVGLLIGIFALIPGIQIVGAALMCVPFRGNIPIAAAMTFLSMPLTTPFILIGAAWTGNLLGFHADIATFDSMLAHNASLREWGYWLISDAGPALVIGLFVIALVTAVVGYLIAVFTWNWWVRHKRRVKLEAMKAEQG